jgi:hypothetical protein
MGFLLVIKADLVRGFIIMRRYWFATLTSMIVGYGMMLVLILGFMAGTSQGKVSTVMQGQQATNWALGFVIGMFAFGIVGMFSQGLQAIARTGELEQVCMSPHGLVTIFLGRTVVAAATTIPSLAIILMLIAATLSGSLHFDLLPMLALLILTYANLIGFGFMVGGLVLVFKQTGQIAILLRMVLIGLALVASENVRDWPALARWPAHILPVTDAAICLKYTLIHGQLTPVRDANGQKIVKEIVPVLDEEGEPMLDEQGNPMTSPIYEMEFASVFGHESFLFLTISCVIWTLIGIACFRFMENWSRDKGTLGAY